MWAAKNNSSKLASFLSTYHDVELVVPRSDLNIQNKNNVSALIFSAFNGHEDIAKILIHQGANVDLVDSTGTSALLYAIQKGHSQVASFLIDRGANINLADANGKTVALCL